MPKNYLNLRSMYQYAVFAQVVRLLLVEGHVVTLQSFCAHTHFKENRHTRRLLEYFVKLNVIASFVVNFSDGYNRKVYCAQRTRSMFERDYSSSEIDHHRLMPQIFANEDQS